MILCIIILYNFFKIFIEFSIALIRCMWFFNFFLIMENAKNSIKFLLKNHFNFIVLFLLFSMIFWLFLKNSTFVIFRNSFFSMSFSIFIVNFFSFFVTVIFVVIIFFIAFSFSFSILVIFVSAFITFTYVFALIDWLTFCFLIIWNLFSMRFNCKSHRKVIQCDQQQHRYIVSFDR